MQENDILEEKAEVFEINWKQKLSSRVFWLCTAAFLVAVATGIGNSFGGNETAACVAAVCSILAAGIYAAAEKATDIARIKTNTIVTQIVSTTNESSSTTHSQTVEAKSDDALTVATVLAPAPAEEPMPVVKDE